MKTVNFKLLYTAKDQPPQFDLVLVHPFSSKDGPELYRKTLEALLKKVTREEQVRVNAYSVSFDGSKFVTGKTSISAISNELLATLREQGPFPRSEDASETFSAAKVRRQRERPALIFITYSFGSWVARHMLTQSIKPSAWIPDTARMILLDDPKSSNDLDQYLGELWPMLTSQEKPSTINSSSSLIKDIPQDLLDSESLLPPKSSHNDDERRRTGLPQTLIESSCFNLWLPRPVNLANQKSASRPRIISRVIQRIPKRCRVSGAGDSQISCNPMLDNIDKAIRALLNQPLHTTNLEHPLQHPPHTISKDDSIDTNSQDVVPINPTHHIGPTGTQSSNSRVIHRWSEPAHSITRGSIAPDDEGISVGSCPVVIPNDTSNDDLKQKIDLGRWFLKKGEFVSAETTFVRCHYMLEHLKRDQKVRYSIEIRAQLAGIKLHRGTYKEAQKEFEAILGDMNNDLFKGYEQNVVNRWIATSLLYQGKYKQAADSFNSLLEAFPHQDLDYIETEIPIRRDLALATAFQGNYQVAVTQIETARVCLEKGLRDLDTPSQPPLQPSEVEIPLSTEALETPAAHMPTSCNEIQRNNLSNPLNSKMRNKLFAKRDHIYLTLSKIQYMLGNFKTALETCEIALHGMRTRWGGKHLKTLECASHHSILLALNSRVFEAEAACNSTLIASKSELGSQHPQTLETMGNLVRIFLFQARLVEAVDTAKSLVKTSESSLTASHPQTQRARYLVAKTLLASGDYASAEVKLEEIISIANEMYMDHHPPHKSDIQPDTLHYQSRLALTKHYLGKFQEAEELAINVFRKQRFLYSSPELERHISDKTGEVRFSESKNTLSGYQSAIESLLVIMNGESDDLVHPRLLRTLRTIALITLHRKDLHREDLGDLSIRILEAIRNRNRYRLNEYSIFTLDSEYDLALAYRERTRDSDNQGSLEKAIEHMRLAYQGRFSIFGPKHPGTASARRELIMTNTILGKWEPPLGLSRMEGANHVTEESMDDNRRGNLLYSYDEEKHAVSPSTGSTVYKALGDTGEYWRRVKGEVYDIVYQHERSIGKHHPETLKSLSWLFAVQVHLRDIKGVGETLRKGLQLFRHSSIRHERLIEVLNLERQFASILSVLGGRYDEDALKILHEISYTIEEPLKTNLAALQPSLKLLKSGIDNDICALSSR
ncbi:hypothetical protein GGR51DRAFT_543589 [Nemania sp. FL0031]|nr:hypothetical protein GGR51DRAFT_543589 [Nemania sp. FL0031]